MKSSQTLQGLLIAGLWLLSPQVSAQTASPSQPVAPAGASSDGGSAASAESATAPWLGPDGMPLPLPQHSDVLELLRRGRVLSQEVLAGGSTRPIKVRLEHKRIQANAIFRQIDISLHRVKVDGKVHNNFRDSYTFECVAYELSRMLGIDNVPPCVERSLKDQQGSLQLWVEQAMTEKARRAENRPLEDPMRWAREKQTLRLFDSLIANIDRNQGNMLIDRRGKLWFIDHTRSFGTSKEALAPERIVWCDRRVWEGLKGLDEAILERSFSHVLSKEQLRALMLRRDQIQAHLEARIQSLGAEAVLFDLAVPSALLADRSIVEGDTDFPANTSLPDLGG